jgi:hypothetical protein
MILKRSAASNGGRVRTPEGRFPGWVTSFLSGIEHKMNTKDLVTVYTLSNPVKAEIIRAALQAQGIRCFLDGLNTAESASIGAFEINVQVPAGDADRATRFIESHEARRLWTTRKSTRTVRRLRHPVGDSKGGPSEDFP